MFVPVNITTNGEAIYARGFDMLEREAGDLTVPLSAIGGRLIEDVGAQLGTEGSWSGNPWQQLSDKYQKWKDQHVPGLPKLVGIRRTGDIGQRPQTYERSGRMRAELLDAASVHVSPRRMIYAPTSDIAGYHEFGTSKMPARPPVEVPPGELREWDRLFIRWMNGLLVQAGLTG